MTEDKLKSYVLNALFIFEAAKLIKFIDWQLKKPKGNTMYEIIIPLLDAKASYIYRYAQGLRDTIKKVNLSVYKSKNKNIQYKFSLGGTDINFKDGR